MAASATSQMVDFSNVKDGGNFNTSQVASGDYLAKITKVEDAKSKGDDTHMYVFTIKLTKHSSYAYPYYCKLQENQLWKLRNLLIAAGMTVPKKRMKLDPNKVVGKTVGVTMEDDEYEGKMKSVVAAIFPAAELMDGSEAVDDDDDETEEEYETEEADEVEDDEDEAEEEADEEDDLAGMDRLELRKELKRLKPEITTNKKMSDDDIRDLIRDARGDAAEPEDEDDEEDEPEPPKKAKKAPAKKSKKKASEVSDEELEELDIDDL